MRILALLLLAGCAVTQDPLQQTLTEVSRQFRYMDDWEQWGVAEDIRLQIDTFRAGKTVYGDCDDHALLVHELLAERGIRSTFLVSRIHQAGYTRTVRSRDLHVSVQVGDSVLDVNFPWVQPMHEFKRKGFEPLYVTDDIRR